MKKQFTFPPKEEFERVVKRAQISDRRTNIGLLPNSTSADKAKYNLCKSIAFYGKVNNISEKELAKKLGVSHSKLETIIFCHIDKLSLEELWNYVGSLTIPLELKINDKYVWKKSFSEAR